MGKFDNYECDGQISVFDYLKEIAPEKRPVTKHSCTIIGKECKAHTYKGCTMPDKCELIKEVVKNNNICEFSGHTCNKTELWKVAYSLDNIECPEKCCRQCDVEMCGARCNGSKEPKKQKDRKQELDEKYAIPRKHQKEEGWTDDWHYTELETPTETGIYYCIHYGYKSNFYNYTYMAWAYGHWWAYAGYGTKWLIIWEGSKRDEWLKPFAWVTVPDLYYRTDEHYQFLFENFVTKEDWEYEERIEKIRCQKGVKC